MAISKLTKPAGSVPAEFHVDSFVSPRFGVVYHCIPKTLSRSMLEYLAAIDPDGYRIAERGVGKEVLVAGAGTAAPVGFTFARNPYSRAVAVYYNKFVNYLDTPGQRAMFAQYEQLRPEMTFSEFVEWLATDEATDRRADPHFLPQYYYLLDVNGAPAVDYLGRVEHAAADMDEIQGILGLRRAPLPHVNSNALGEREAFDTSRRWREVLDERTTRVLTNRYEGDFELLGYERLPYTVRPLFSRGDITEAARNQARPRRLTVAIKHLFASLGFELRRTPRGRRRHGRS